MTEVRYGSFTTVGVFDGDYKSMFDLIEKILDPMQSPVTANPGDDVMCWMKGNVLEGIVTDALVDSWVKEGTVYLLDQVGNESEMVYAGVNTEEHIIFLLFSASDNFIPSQIQMIDALVDLP